jgi:hypothetical protein
MYHIACSPCDPLDDIKDYVYIYLLQVECMTNGQQHGLSLAKRVDPEYIWSTLVRTEIDI